MMAPAKALAARLLPAPIAAWLRSLLRGGTAKADAPGPVVLDWEMMPDTDATWSLAEGWSHASVVAKQAAGWDEFLRGLADARPAYVPIPEDPSVAIDVGVHNTLMIFVYLLGRLASERSGARPSILDWGGGLGQHYRFAQAFYPAIDWDYAVREVPSLAAAGAERNPNAAFFATDDAALARRYGAVYASGSIMYARDVYRLVGRLCDAAERYLLVTRTPFVQHHDDFVVVQRPYRYGYDTEYAGWFLNLAKFRRFVEQRGFVLDREFPLAMQSFVPNAPEQCRYRALLFRRTEDAA